MPGLPDIPLQLWRDFSSQLFGEKADATESAESFRWGVDDALNSLPPDDGMNWEAEQRRLEEEQQRRQEEERRAIEEQARRDQEAWNQREEERAAAARAAQMSMYAPPVGNEPYDPRQYDEGPRESGYSLPPAEPERPMSFADTVGGLWNQTFGSAPPPPEPPPPEPEPEAPPASFADTVSGLWEQTFGPVADTAGRAVGAVRDAYRVPVEERPPAYSGPSYAQPSLAPGQPSMLDQASDTVAGAGRGLVEGIPAAVETADRALMGPKVSLPTWEDPLAPVREVGQHIRAHPTSVLPLSIYGEAQQAATKPIGIRAVEAAGGGTDPLFRYTIPESVPYYGGTEIAPSAQDVGGFVSSAVLDPLNFVGAAGAGLAGRGVRHVAAEALRGLPLVGEGEALLRGGTGLARRAGRADALNAAQGGVMGAASEDLQAQAEGREADPAERARRALIGGVLGVGAGSRTARRAAGRALGSGVVPEGAPPARLAPTVFEPPASARALPSPTVPSGTPQIGDRIVLPDGTPGVVGSLSQQRRGGQTLSWMTVHTEDGGKRQISLPPSAPAAASGLVIPPGQVTPGPAVPGRVTRPAGSAPPAPPNIPPPPPGGPPPPPAGGAPGGPPSSGVARAAADYDKILAERRAVAAGAGRMQTNPEVGRVLGGIKNMIRGIGDRRSNIGALERHVEKLRGAALSVDERAHLRSALYEGRGDAALALLQREVQPALAAVSKADQVHVEALLEQLDNADKAVAVGQRVEREALSNVPEGRAPVGEVRREGEAVLNEQRARSNLSAAERDYVRVRATRDQIVAQHQAVEGAGMAGMETEASLRANERLENANRRFLEVEAKREDAARILREAVASSRARAESQVMERGAVRGAEAEAGRMFSGGARGQDVDDALEQLVHRLGPERAQKVVDAADAFYRVRDTMRKRLVDAGIWSEEQAQDLMDRFPHYAPIEILEHLDDAVISSLPHGGRTLSVGSNGIKRLTEAGTEKVRRSPVESLVDMTFRAEDMARRNQIMRAVHGWADTPGMEHFVKHLGADEAAEKGWTALPVMIDGAKQRVAVIDELAESLTLSTPGATGLLGGLLAAMRLPLQAGATALRPSFVFTNAINDAIWTLSRFAVDAPNPIEGMRSVTDLLSGYRASFGTAPAAARTATGAFIGGGTEAIREDPNDPNYLAKVAAGTLAGGAAGYGTGTRLASRLGVGATDADRALIQRTREAGGSIGLRSRYADPKNIVRQLQGEHVWVRSIDNPQGIRDLIRQRSGQVADVAGLVWSRPLAAIGGAIEQAPRIAAAGRAERQGKTAEQAAQAHRRVTADFDAGGRFTKHLNQMVPFVNASTQAAREGFALAERHPAKFAALMSTIVGGIVLNEIYNRSVAPDDYKDVSQHTKDTGLPILSDRAPEAGGKRGLAFIPLRGVVGSMVPITRAALGAYFGDDPRTWDQIAREVGLKTVESLSPIGPDVGGLLRAGTPPIVALGGELVANYDAFRDQPIVPRSQEGLPVSEQYSAQTSQAARHLSRSQLPLVGGVSPLKIDYAVRGFSPGPGEALLGAADMAIRAAGQDLPTVERNVPKGARDVPIVGGIAGRVLRTVGSERQNRAYELADTIAAKNRPQVVAAVEASREYQTATADRRQQLLRSAETALVEQSQELAGVPEFAKPKDLGLPRRFPGVDPGSAREREIISAISTPQANRTARQWGLAAQYEYAQNPLYTSEAREDRDEAAVQRDAIKASVRR
jgi:hypothetical protein